MSLHLGIRGSYLNVPTLDKIQKYASSVLFPHLDQTDLRFLDSSIPTLGRVGVWHSEHSPLNYMYLMFAC